MPLALLGAVYEAASSAGYLLMMVDALQRPWQVDALLDRRVDGFVVVAPELTDFPLPESVAAVPTVMVNCLDPSLGASSLVPDEVGAGAAAAQHLLASGHDRLAVVAGTEGLSSERRVLGVRRAVQNAGLPDPVVLRAGHGVDDGYAATRRLLESDHAPSALVCVHERLALGALLAVTDLGLNVPDDLSLVSLDDGENLAATAGAAGRPRGAAGRGDRRARARPPGGAAAPRRPGRTPPHLRLPGAARGFGRAAPAAGGGGPGRLAGSLARAVRAQGRASVQPSTIPGSASTTQRLVAVG